MHSFSFFIILGLFLEEEELLVELGRAKLGLHELKAAFPWAPSPSWRKPGALGALGALRLGRLEQMSGRGLFQASLCRLVLGLPVT